mgnify:CR=1 FL=1
MNLVLCMAGLYKRFRDAGYDTPKFLLPWAGRTVLETILDEMLGGGAFSRAVLVGNVRDAAHEARLRNVLKRAAVDTDLKFVSDTGGQAETALIAARYLDTRFDAGGEPVVFHNVDTVLLGRDYHDVAAALGEWDGYLDVFPSASPNFSYAATDETGAVTAVAEKRVISPFASTGLYGFRSAAAYAEWAEWSTFAGEFYVSDVFRRVLADGGRVTLNRSSVGHRTIVLGTPAEYETARTAA